MLDDLENGSVGGILFLAENIANRSDLEAMVRKVKQCDCMTIPLIAIDEEGGEVDPLASKYGFQHTPSALEIARGSEEIAREQYRSLAGKLVDIGFNVNFAPVVDLNLRADNPIIGARERSFSANAAVVERYATIFIEEHRARGILTTLKHFPGHGSSSTDSHVAVTDVEQSWSPDELKPYRHLIQSDMVDAIMIGHLRNHQQWGGIATQAGSTAINGLLRNDLGFDGVAVSDDLTMEGVGPESDDVRDVIISAVNTGVDLLLIAHPVTEGSTTGSYINSALVRGMKSGKISSTRVDKSLQRLALMKSKLKKLIPKPLQGRKDARD